MQAALKQSVGPLLEAVNRNPADYDALVKLGDLYYDGQQFPSAIPYYERALAIHPEVGRLPVAEVHVPAAVVLEDSRQCLTFLRAEGVVDRLEAVDTLGVDDGGDALHHDDLALATQRLAQPLGALGAEAGIVAGDVHVARDLVTGDLHVADEVTASGNLYRTGPRHAAIRGLDD